ncbi:MAG: transposase family protein [Gemmatimonadaceae bacterium]
MPGCRVERVTRRGSAEVVIAVYAERDGARCPDCGRESRAVHSTYTRSPADLPALGRAVRLRGASTCMGLRAETQ